MNRFSENSITNRFKRRGRQGLVGRLVAATAMTAMVVCLTGFASAQSPAEITVNVSKSVLKVAEPFQLELKFIAPADTKVFFPSVGEQLGTFDIVDHHDVFDIPAGDSADSRSWTRLLTLESIYTGNLEIPPVEIQVRQDSTVNSIRSKAITVRVTSVLEDRADPTQFRDIQSVVDVPVPQRSSNSWVWWSLGGLGIATAVVVATIVLVSRRKQFLTPAQWALEELDELSGSDSIRNDNAEPVLRTLSEILRDYLQLQFETSAPCQTTPELLQLVKSNPLMESETADQFGELLTMADEAKFAGAQLTQSELEQTVEKARCLIGTAAANFVQAQTENQQPYPSELGEAK